MSAAEWVMRVEKGLEAHFNQKDGPSRPGVMWAVQLKKGNAEKIYTVMVKALFAEDLATQLRSNQEYQAQIAMQYLSGLLEQGWHPDKEMEHTVTVGNPSSARNKPWWRLW